MDHCCSSYTAQLLSTTTSTSQSESRMTICIYFSPSSPHIYIPVHRFIYDNMSLQQFTLLLKFDLSISLWCGPTVQCYTMSVRPSSSAKMEMGWWYATGFLLYSLPILSGMSLAYTTAVITVCMRPHCMVLIRDFADSVSCKGDVMQLGSHAQPLIQTVPSFG